MTKVAEVIRFYSLDKIMDFMEKGGEYPRHHLWCYDQIKENGIPAECIEFNNQSKLNKLGKKLKLVNLQQQINLLKRSREFDVIFAPFISDVFLLAILKIAGLYKKPIVGLAFETYIPYKTHVLKKLRQKLLRYIFLNGIESLKYQFENLYNKSNQYGGLKKNHHFLQTWGADFEFFESFTRRQQNPPALDYIYSTGGTERDYKTLIDAFKGIDFKLKITTKRALEPNQQTGITPNIEIDNSIKPGLHSVGLIRKDYYNCLAVAIPTINQADYWPVGSTVIMEALAMGKPIIATSNKMYPFNLEKEKVGFEVAYGDVDGWQQCVNYLINNPDETRKMGERAKHLCKKKYNYTNFSDEIVGEIKKYIPTETTGKSSQSTKISKIA